MSAEDEWLVSEEEEGNVRMESRDRVKMELQQHSGLENGQMAMMQIGFDHGYTSVGVKAGLALGEMRGEIDALLAFALKETSPPKKCVQEELFALQRELATFELNDMAEPDWELVHEEIKRYAYNPDASLEAKKEAWAQQQKRVHGLRARLDKCWQFWA